MALPLPRYERPVFTDDETAFLQAYARTLDRVDAMRVSGLALALQLNPADERQLELSARGAFGNFSFQIKPQPQPHIVALSLLAALRRLTAPITFA